MTKRRHPGYYDADHASRVEPNHGVEQMPAPDWANVLVHPQEKKAPVGDPTRWGAVDTTDIRLGAISQSTSQILQIETRDAYSRGWSMLGTLSMPYSVWFSGVGNPVLASIVLNMGVGQVKLSHEICLWAGGGAAGAPGGLCYQQDLVNGGPYLSSDLFAKVVNGVTITYQTRAFSIVGGLVGQSISVVGKYIAVGVNPELPAPGLPSLIVTPHAAGAGL